ncbi:thermonuclease family protein [Neobacillus sp. SAB-20_R2A]|uniref:thermonuclease family protein n=1 Tax=Neobacillus sp. SAB-20_R2A TaxID=3120519 RepID=UPI003C6E593C
MKKQIAGLTLIAGTALLALQPGSLQNNWSSVQQNRETTPALASSFYTQERVPAVLVETIDGDTIRARVNGKVEAVRYLLIDTPESKKPGMCTQPYAKEAFSRNDELVKSGGLTLVLEEGNTRDAYGRLLAYVYVDGKSVQEILLKEGFARVAYVMNPPYKFLTLFRDDEQLAIRNKANIWSSPGFVTKWGFNGCLD